MIRPVVCLVDNQRAPVQRLGLRRRFVAQSNSARFRGLRDIGIVPPVAHLVDGQRSLIERLGFRKAAPCVEQDGKIVEAIANWG